MESARLRDELALEKWRKKLRRLTSSAKYWLLKYLRENSIVQRLTLEPYVLSRINITQKRDETMVHRTKPIHSVAFILAYKELEAQGEIEIKRGSIPFPMTDFETTFTLKGGDKAE